MIGNTNTYYSIEYATHKEVDETNDNIYINYPMEYLNSNREELFPLELNLEIDAVVMLIRNFSILEELCNGTCLKITKFFLDSVKVKIMTGEDKKEKVLYQKLR